MAKTTVYMTTRMVVEALREAGYPMPANNDCARMHVVRMSAALPHATRTIGGHRRYSPNTVQQFIEEWQTETEPSARECG